MTIAAGPAGQVRRSLGHQPYWVELLSGGTAAAWGWAVLRLPGGLAERAPYHPLARFAPDHVWASVAILGAAVQLATALLNVRHLRPIVDVAMAMFWLLLADGVQAGTPDSPTTAPYLGLVAANLVSIGYLLAPAARRVAAGLRCGR